MNSNSWHEFCQRLSQKDTSKVIFLSPKLDRLPLPIQRFDEPLYPLSKSFVDITHSLVGAYIFDLAAYLATGAAGIIALERALAFTRAHNVINILHGPFTGSSYAVLADEISLNVDSFTVTTSHDLEYYISNPPHSAFLWNTTEEVKVGGIITNEQLILYETNKPIRTMQVFDTDDLLTSLQDDYLEHIISNLTGG